MKNSNHLLLLLLLTVTTVTVLSSEEDHQHADRIIEAMIGGGDFRDWAADFLSAVDDQFGIPLSATIFIPNDFDAADISSLTPTGGATSRLSVAYHIIPQRLSFSDLQLLEPLARLPTLLPGNSIVVTNNSVSRFTLDGVIVTEPDLFLSSAIAIHGVASPLDYSTYGDDVIVTDSLRGGSRRRRRPSPHEPHVQFSGSVSTSRFSSCFLLPVAMTLI